MKRYTKLLAATFLLLTAMVMVIATSYAWLTLSENPTLEKIQVTIGGSSTVLVAPDITVTDEDGNVYHYPGAFSDTLDFSEFDQYSYLRNSAGLVPVSTADGETWYLPAYYEAGDEQVLSGAAAVGQLRPISDFIPDYRLEYANLSTEEADAAQTGSYIYLDFWVVAPVEGYRLRVSNGTDSIGSYVIDLIEPEKIETENGVSYALTGENRQTAASIRLGFLVNENTVLDNSMLYYSSSADFRSEYTRLQGVYTEPGSSPIYSDMTRFTIFEPNGDLHPQTVLDAQGNPVVNGQYVLTTPVGRDAVATNISDRLTVQLENRWIRVGEEPLIAQMFQAYLLEKNLEDQDEQSLKQGFYSRYLPYPYLTKGNFVTKTSALYAAAENGIVSAENIAGLEQSGATEDVYLTELRGGIPQRIRLFIWLEGQDVDCINTASAGSIAVSIELAGSNAEQ